MFFMSQKDVLRFAIVKQDSHHHLFQVRLKEATQDENMREMKEILALLADLGVTAATEKRCAKAESKLRQMELDYARKKKFLNELVEKNDVHQRSIMEMLIRDLGDLGYDQSNDPEIAEAVLLLERLRVDEAANKALADALVLAMQQKDVEALRVAIQDFTTAGLTNADGPLEEAKDALPRLREAQERLKKEKSAALEKAIQRNSVLALELAIAEFNEAGLKPADGPVLEAAMVLEMIQEAKRKRHQGYDAKLRDAMKNERLALVESLVHEIESEGLSGQEVPALPEAMAWMAQQRAEIAQEEAERKAQDQDWSHSQAHLAAETKEMAKCEEACKFSTADARLRDKLERHKIRCLVLESRALLFEGQSASKNLAFLQQKQLTEEEKEWVKELTEAEDTAAFKKQLRDATLERDAHLLELVVKRIQKAGLQKRMAAELAEAEKNIKVGGRGYCVVVEVFYC